MFHVFQQIKLYKTYPSSQTLGVFKLNEAANQIIYGFLNNKSQALDFYLNIWWLIKHIFTWT